MHARRPRSRHHGRVTSQSMTIPGVAGTVETAEASAFSGPSFTVNGEKLKPKGLLRSKIDLPAQDGGTKEARIKGGALRAHPSLVVDGQEYHSGPPTPPLLQGLALLPILGLVIIQGALGFLLVFGGIGANMAVIRSDRSEGAKLGIIIATGVGVIAVCIILAVAVVSATS